MTQKNRRRLMRFWPASTKANSTAGRLALYLPLAALLAAGSAFGATGWRSAVHENFARLVFDLPNKIDFDSSVDGTQLTVRFSAALPEGFSAGQLAPISEYVKNPVISSDRRMVTFDLARSVTARAFSADSSAVIDLTDAKASAAPAAAPAAQGQAAAAPNPTSSGEAVTVRVGEHDDFIRLAFDWPKNVGYKLSNDGSVVRLSFARPGAIDVAALKKRLPKAIGAFDANTVDGALVVSMTVPPNAKLRDSRNDTTIVLDVVASPDAAPVAAPSPSVASNDAAPKPAEANQAAPKPVALAPLEKKPAEPAIAATIPVAAPAAAPAPTVVNTPPAAPPSAASRPAADVSVGVSLAGGTTFKFPWDPAPGVAVFTRGSSLYVVFDQPARFELSALQRVADKVGTLDQLAVGEGAALRIPLKSGQTPEVAKDKGGWTISLKTQSGHRSELPVQAKPDSFGSPSSTVSIDTTDASTVVNVPDADTQQILAVIPVGVANRGIEKERQFAQFSILPSVQGAVIAKRADSVNVAVVNAQVQIGGARGVFLSQKLPGASSGGKVYDFARWVRPDVNFIETKQSLQRMASDADSAVDADLRAKADPEPDRDRAANLRFQLAQFFIANDHAADAIGVLGLLTLSKPDRANSPEFKALRGAAYVMLGNGKQALADLQDPKLDREPEALLWRAAAIAQTGDWAKADDAFRRAASVPSSYPVVLRAKLLLLAADAALNIGNIDRARNVLIDFPIGSGPKNLVQRALFQKARIRIAEGNAPLAMPILDDLIANGGDWARAHAEVLRVDQLLGAKKIKPEEALDRLERVRYDWSGDELEYDILKKLGDLYFQTGRPREGLQRLRDAATYFADQPDNGLLKSHMSDLFASIYTSDDAEKVPALTALSVYDDFRDLTPSGAPGDLMIQRLADRLVKIDLLDRAAELLDYQIRNRLTGIDRVKVASRLAVIDLLDHKPEEAITALDFVQAKDIPADLAVERHRLRAQALMETGQSEQALAEIAGDNAREAELLRADIYAKDKNWGKVAEVYARLVGSPNQGAFDAPRENLLTKLAIALVLAGDRPSVNKLHADFLPKLKDGPNKDAFELLTSNGSPVNSIDSAALSLRFSELAQFQSAMDSYRESLKSGKLSALN
jgi:hypothetical protein